MSSLLALRKLTIKAQTRLKSLFNSAIRRSVIQSEGKHNWRES
jgi:hypothetical protein